MNITEQFGLWNNFGNRILQCAEDVIITLNVSCLSGDCGSVNVSLDPEMIEKIIRGQVESTKLDVGGGGLPQEQGIIYNEYESFSLKILNKLKAIFGFCLSNWDIASHGMTS